MQPRRPGHEPAHQDGQRSAHSCQQHRLQALAIRLREIGQIGQQYAQRHGRGRPMQTGGLCKAEHQEDAAGITQGGSHGDQRGVDREAGTQHLPTHGQQQQHRERNGRSNEQRKRIQEQMTAA